MPKIILNGILQTFTNNQKIIELPASTIQESLQTLVQHYPRLKPYLFNASGNINPFMCIYYNNEDVRHHLATSISAQDEIHIIPAVAGG